MELLDSKVVYEGYGVDVEIRHYRRLDGTEVERQVIDHPGSVAILAHDDEFVYLVAQPREAVEEDALLEIPAQRRLLRLQAAQLYDEQLTEPDQAVTHLRAVLDDSPSDPEALAALDTIFAREERHADLLEVLDLRAAGAKDAASRDELALRAARVTEVDLSDVEGGIGRYQKILAVSPANAGPFADLVAARRRTHP